MPERVVSVEIFSYQRTAEGWKFAERVYEVRYLDTSPVAGSAPHAAGSPD